MPRTAFSAQTPEGPYTLAPSAGDLDLTMTVGDVANGNEVAWTSTRMLVIVQNTDGANPYTTTIASSADGHGRLSTITGYSLAAADVAAFIVARDGWEQSGGLLYLDSENAAIKYAVLTL